jgi:predicted O-methyltransferase YrrM
MEFDKIVEGVQGLRWLTADQGRILYNLVMDEQIQDILELGFCHGVSTAYLAGALDQKGKPGKITTIDKPESKLLSPNIDTLLGKLGLAHRVQPIYADHCYTWELLKLLERKPRPRFDLIFIDGAHVWKTDALAFFLCDKMLSENGYIIFDDLSWTITRDADPNDRQWSLKYSEEERLTPHIRRVFDLLVKEHPRYGHFREESGFGSARKIGKDQVNFLKESTKVKPVLVTKEMMEKMMRSQK